MDYSYNDWCFSLSNVFLIGIVDANGHEQTRWPDWNLRGVGFDGWSVKLVEA
jgi:hypothetical protein